MRPGGCLSDDRAVSEPGHTLNSAPDAGSGTVAPGPVGVVDIGSNTVRLVVYDGGSRAPLVMFNESAFCGLGRDIATSDRLSPEAIEEALRTINRFSRLARGMGVEDLSLIATAAVRDAVNGPEFAARVLDACGERVEILSGEDEARLSAYGVISAIPNADGIIGDLGGGSLELIEVERGAVRRQTTLPLGILRLSALHAENRDEAVAAIQHRLAQPDWLRAGQGRTFYPVGGAWRALARLHMAHTEHPLHMIDGYSMSAGDIDDFADLVGALSPRSLHHIPGIARRRRESLPLASDLMHAVVSRTGTSQVVFPAQGLREGLLYTRLSETHRVQDPVMVAAEAMAGREARSGAIGRPLFDWIEPLFKGRHEGRRRLRLVACHLADIGWREHPDYRAVQTFNRLLRFPFSGLGHDERAFLAFVGFIRYGGDLAEPEVQAVHGLMSKRNLRRAETVGQAIRLAFRVSGGARDILERSALRLAREKVYLKLPADGSSPLDDAVERHFEALVAASRLGRGGIIQ